MAVDKFLGFRQVTKDAWNEISNEDKKGYLWFVRNIKSVAEDGTEDYDGDIYFGTRHYGSTASSDDDVIDAGEY